MSVSLVHPLHASILCAQCTQHTALLTLAVTFIHTISLSNAGPVMCLHFVYLSLIYKEVMRYNHFVIQLMHNIKNVELLKHIKIMEADPTCFGLERNHHQGATASA